MDTYPEKYQDAVSWIKTKTLATYVFMDIET